MSLAHEAPEAPRDHEEPNVNAPVDSYLGDPFDTYLLHLYRDHYFISIETILLGMHGKERYIYLPLYYICFKLI